MLRAGRSQLQGRCRQVIGHQRGVIHRVGGAHGRVPWGICDWSPCGCSCKVSEPACPRSCASKQRASYQASNARRYGTILLYRTCEGHNRPRCASSKAAASASSAPSCSFVSPAMPGTKDQAVPQRGDACVALCRCVSSTSGPRYGGHQRSTGCRMYLEISCKHEVLHSLAYRGR
jgi:hypothetical protein